MESFLSLKRERRLLLSMLKVQCGWSLYVSSIENARIVTNDFSHLKVIMFLTQSGQIQTCIIWHSSHTPSCALHWSIWSASLILYSNPFINSRNSLLAFCNHQVAFITSYPPFVFLILHCGFLLPRFLAWQPNLPFTSWSNLRSEVTLPIAMEKLLCTVSRIKLMFW